MRTINHQCIKLAPREMTRGYIFLGGWEVFDVWPVLKSCQLLFRLPCKVCGSFYLIFTTLFARKSKATKDYKNESSSSLHASHNGNRSYECACTLGKNINSVKNHQKKIFFQTYINCTNFQ